MEPEITCNLKTRCFQYLLKTANTPGLQVNVAVSLNFLHRSRSCFLTRKQHQRHMRCNAHLQLDLYCGFEYLKRSLVFLWYQISGIFGRVLVSFCHDRNSKFIRYVIRNAILSINNLFILGFKSMKLLPSESASLIHDQYLL